MLVYRQLLGDVSKDEVVEVNRVFGKETGLRFTKGWKEPASILGWHTVPITMMFLLGVGISSYALMVKKYNILWLVGPFVPLDIYLFGNWARQPTQEVENAYKYLLAKRAGTCEYEKNHKRFMGNKMTQSKEF